MVERLKNNKAMLFLLCAAIMLSLVFVFNFFKNDIAFAAADEMTNLVIDGKSVNISGDEAELVGDETEPRWVLFEGVLTLNNYAGGAISAQGNLNLVLSENSENTITSPAGISVVSSIGGTGSLNISGSGNLNIVSQSENSSVDCIRAEGNISITNSTLNLVSSSNGLTAVDGLSRAIASDLGSIQLNSANISANVLGAYAYGISTSSSAPQGYITITASIIDCYARGTIGDTSLRTEGTGGNISVTNSNINLEGVKPCVFAGGVSIAESSINIEAVDGGLQARNSVSIDNTTLKILITGNGVDNYGIKCMGGSFTSEGNDLFVYIESKVYGIMASGDINFDGGKVQVLTSGAGSYAVFTESDFYINGGTAMLVGNSGGVVAHGAVFSHSEELTGDLKLLRKLVYFSPSGELFGGEKYLIIFRDTLYCQFEVIDKLETEGWKLDFDVLRGFFILTLKNYDGGRIFTDTSLEIVSSEGSFNKLSDANNSVVVCGNSFAASGDGFLEIAGPSGEFKSAVYVKNSIALKDTNFVATAGGYGIECYDGEVTIDGGRVAASGGRYTIFASGGLKLGGATYLQEDFSSDGIYSKNGKTLIKNNVVSNNAPTILKVNAVSIDSSQTVSGSGFKWDANLNLLILDNYDGSFIFANGVLDIEVKKLSVNKINNLAKDEQSIENIVSFCGIAATGELKIAGEGSIEIDVEGMTANDMVYGIYAYNSINIFKTQITVGSSTYGIFSKTSTITIEGAALAVDTLDDAVRAYGTITFKNCDSQIFSYATALFSTIARIVFEGGDASVYGGDRSAVANLGVQVGETTYLTGTLSDETDSQLFTAFTITDGVFISTFERAIFKINGQFHNYEGTSIDNLSTEGWKFDYDSSSSKYILYLNNYSGGSIKFSLNLEIVLSGDCAVSFADNIGIGNTYSCIDIGGSLTLVGNGSLTFATGGEEGGIGFYTIGNLTVNGNILINATAIARGMAVGGTLNYLDGDYEGKYISANAVNLYGGKLTIDTTLSGTGCIQVAKEFRMTGGTCDLKTNAAVINLACVSAQRVSILNGSFKASATGALGRGISAALDIILSSAFIECYGGGAAVFSENADLKFGNAVLSFLGADKDSAVKSRKSDFSEKYLRTQEFLFAADDLIFDNLDLSNSNSVDLSANIEYLEQIVVGGRVLSSEDYIKEGSNIIFSESFLKSLPNGVYRLELYFGDGFTKTVSLTILNSDIVDGSNIFNPVGIIIVAIISFLLMFAFVFSVFKEYKKPKKDKNSFI